MNERSSLNMADLPSNSKTTPPNETRPKPKTIAKPVTTKKPGLGRKFADVFLGEEVKDVKSYILQDVIIPTLKNTIIDVVSGGIEMLLLGKTSNRRSSGNRSNNGHTPYSSYYYGGQPQKQQPNNYHQQPVSRYGVDDLIFQTHSEASDLLAAMFDYMKDYDGMISVADLYEMVGHPSVYTDNAWGWTDLGSANIRRVRDGFLLVLPKPVALK